PLNLNLARRLEIALVLANEDKPGRTLGIIKNASATAAATPGANHLTSPGRQKLFQATYPLAWGNQRVSADAFLTRYDWRVRPERGQMLVILCAVDKNGKSFSGVVPEFAVKMDLRTYDDAGETYDLRGLFDAEDEKEDKKPDPAQKQERAELAAEKSRE